MKVRIFFGQSKNVETMLPLRVELACWMGLTQTAG